MSNELVTMRKVLCVLGLLSLASYSLPVITQAAATPLPSRMDGLPPCSQRSAISLSVSPYFQEDGRIYLVDSTLLQAHALYRSSDGGEHWEAILRPQSWYDHAAIRQFAIAPMRSPQGLILYARAALWYTGGSTYALLRSVDSGDTWTIDQMCDESLAYCRNWVGFYLTNQTNVWFVPRRQTNINFEADIQRWDNSPWFPQVDTVWNETGAYGLSISPDYASDRLLYASLYPTSPTLQTALIRSSDGGDTWQNGSTEGLCPGWAADMRFSPAFAEDRTVFALQQGAVFKSVDAGATWRHVYPPGGAACQVPQRDQAANELTVSPRYAVDQTLYALVPNHDPFETSLLVSTDGGASWREILRQPGGLDKLIVAPNPPQAERHVSLDMMLPTSSAKSVSEEQPALHENLVSQSSTTTHSLEPLYLTLFLRRFQVGTGHLFHYRSDDGGVTWRCLALPPRPRAYLPVLLKSQ